MSLLLAVGGGGPTTSPVSGVCIARTVAVGALTGIIALAGIAVSSNTATGQILGKAPLSGVAIASTTATGFETGSEAESGVAIASTVATGAMTGALAVSGGAITSIVAIGNLGASGSNVAASGAAIASTVSIGSLSGDSTISGVAIAMSQAIGDLLAQASGAMSGIAIASTAQTGYLLDATPNVQVVDTHDPGYQVIRESDLKRWIERLKGKKRKRALELIEDAQGDQEQLSVIAQKLDIKTTPSVVNSGDDEDVLIALHYHERLLVKKVLH